MAKINSPQDLAAVRDKAIADIDLRVGQKDMRVTVHMGTCGIAAGARDVLSALLAALSDAKADNASVHQAGCAGLCDQEPMITIEDKSGKSYRYGRCNKNKVAQIVREHVVRGLPVTEYLLKA